MQNLSSMHSHCYPLSTPDQVVISNSFSQMTLQLSYRAEPMESLSVTASTITLIATVKKTLEVLQKMRHAPQGLDALIQEASDLALVLRDVEPFLRTSEPSPQDGAEPQPQDLGLLQWSERAKSTLNEIEDLAMIHVSSKGPGSQLRGLCNNAKVVSQLNTKRQDLQTVKFNLLVVSS